MPHKVKAPPVLQLPREASFHIWEKRGKWFGHYTETFPLTEPNLTRCKGTMSMIDSFGALRGIACSMGRTKTECSVSVQFKAARREKVAAFILGEFSAWTDANVKNLDNWNRNAMRLIQRKVEERIDDLMAASLQGNELATQAIDLYGPKSKRGRVASGRARRALAVVQVKRGRVAEDRSDTSADRDTSPEAPKDTP